tara:strand:- start:176 stop:502 length:327 start_codon:yes stop_codon:yes gene_type:complete
MDLNNVRNELIKIEDELINLLEKRVNLGIKVAEAKYPEIKNKIQDNNIFELIERKDVEQKVIQRISEKCDDNRLRSNLIRLYKEYLIPKSKEIQEHHIKNKLHKNINF